MSYWLGAATPFIIVAFAAMACLVLHVISWMLGWMMDRFHRHTLHTRVVVDDVLDERGWPRGMRGFVIALLNAPAIHLFHGFGWQIVLVRDYKAKEES